MLPLPNDEPPLEPHGEPIVIDPDEWVPPPALPRANTTPMALWYLWLAVSSLIEVLLGRDGLDDGLRIVLRGTFIGQLLLTPAWAALAIRPLATHIFSVLLVYLFILFIPDLARDGKEIFLILAIVGGAWSLLRWGRVLTLDLLRPVEDSVSRTPRLADQVQFSLRSLILLSAVVAIGISLYLFFQGSSGWQFYKVMFFIVVPSELLLFWGVLGRAKWWIRWPWVLVAVHHWMLLDVVQSGFQSWEQVYEFPDFYRWISIPGGQIVGLLLLRWAGYRIGIPKPRERALPLAVAVESQSPWD